LTFQYDGREVWFVDTQALQVQYQIAKKMGLRGLAVWRLGAEDSQFWTAFQKNR
jgi:spore germination protein YaaH